MIMSPQLIKAYYGMLALLGFSVFTSLVGSVVPIGDFFDFYGTPVALALLTTLYGMMIYALPLLWMLLHDAIGAVQDSMKPVDESELRHHIALSSPSEAL